MEAKRLFHLFLIVRARGLFFHLISFLLRSVFLNDCFGIQLHYYNYYQVLLSTHNPLAHSLSLWPVTAIRRPLWHLQLQLQQPSQKGNAMTIPPLATFDYFSRRFRDGLIPQMKEKEPFVVIARCL